MTTQPFPASEAGTAILRARARQLASAGAAERDAPGESLEVLEFSLAGERYAIETASVRGVHPLQGMVPLPCAPRSVLGVVNVRGQVVPVISFRWFLGLGDGDRADARNLVLLQHGDMEAGFPAGPEPAVRHIALAGLQAGLPGLSGAAEHCIRGITADGITVLDVAGLFADPRMLVNDTEGAPPPPGKITGGTT